MSGSYPRSRGIALAATFAALISVTSPISVPITPQVPITLQVLMVYLILMLLGPWYGTLSLVIYLMLGAAGLPVFAGLSFGTAPLVGPTGGYLFAFPIATLLGGLMARRRSADRRGDSVRVSVACLVALAVIYGIGVVWLSQFTRGDLNYAFTIGALYFIPIDLLKAVVAIPIAVRIRWSSVQLPVNHNAAKSRTSVVTA